MQHYEEYILELYVLDAPEVVPLREEIRAHLLECHGCSMLVSEIGEFYGRLDKEFSQTGEEEKPVAENVRNLPQRRKMSLSPGRRDAALGKLFDTYPQARPHVSLMKKAGVLMQKHPILAGAGTVAMTAIIGAALVIGAKDIFKDKNPAYTLYSGSSNLIEVFNKKNQTLWNLPSTGLGAIGMYEQMSGTQSTQIADFDGDGSNEVVTILDVGGENKAGKASLKIFDAKDQLRMEKTFTADFHFGNRQYPNTFGATSFVIEPAPSGRGVEVFCAASNEFSPSYLARLDFGGNIIGEYWHFGHMMSVHKVSLPGRPRNEIVICAVNDLPDSTHDEYGVIVILDPDKIVGKTSATIVDGYGLQKSGAELYYIRLPRIDMNYLFGDRLFGSVVQQYPDSTIACNVVNEYIPDPRCWFRVQFTQDMRILSIRPSSVTARLHDRLVAEGKLPGGMDTSYIQQFREGIRYWDGSEWKKDAVRVRHAGQSLSYR